MDDDLFLKMSLLVAVNALTQAKTPEALEIIGRHADRLLTTLNDHAKKEARGDE